MTTKKKDEEKKVPALTGMAAVSIEIAKIKKMNFEYLLKYAREKLNLDLPRENGRAWIIKKIGYALQEKYAGPLTGHALERARELDDPKVISEYKTGLPKAPDQKDAPPPVKEEKKQKPINTKIWDEDGFKIGSKGAKLFALLKKGCTIEKFNEVGGASASGFLTLITKDAKNNSWGREAEIEKYGNGKKIRILVYKDKSGTLYKTWWD